MVIINGRRVTQQEMLGSEIIRLAKPGKGRGATIRIGSNAERVKPEKLYRSEDLKDHKGNDVRVESIPDRTKGNSAPSSAMPRSLQ